MNNRRTRPPTPGCPMPFVVPQAAAVPVRDDGLVHMVTSRSRRRWVFPKGRIESHQTAAEAARAEAWEEAGLVGDVEGEAIGSYRYEKFGRDHTVAVFVLRVRQELADWPEKGQRSGEWVTVEEAMARIEEAGLRKLVKAAAKAGRGGRGVVVVKMGRARAVQFGSLVFGCSTATGCTASD